LEKKVKLKGKRVKVMVSNESSCQKEYTWNIKALPYTNQKVWPRLKILKKKSNSMVRGSRSCYQIKGHVIRNSHVKYESPSTYQSNVMTKVLKFLKRRSNSKVKRSRYQIKVLVRRNTNVKYESSTTYQSKVMTKIKVLEN
jgi:hypothetical protein